MASIRHLFLLLVAHVCKHAAGDLGVITCGHLDYNAVMAVLNPMKIAELVIAHGVSKPLQEGQIWHGAAYAKKTVKTVAKGKKRIGTVANPILAKFRKGTYTLKNKLKKKLKIAKSWKFTKKLKTKLKNKRAQYRTGMSRKQLRKKYAQLDQTKRTVSKEQFLHEEEAKCSRGLKGMAQATITVTTFLMLQTNMGILKTEDELINSLKKRLGHFGKRHFGLDPNKQNSDFTSNAWIDAFAHIPAMKEDDIQRASEELSEMEEEVWDRMGKLAEVQGWATLNGVVATGNALWSANTVVDLLKSRDWSAIDLAASVVSFAGSCFNLGWTAQQWRAVNEKVSALGGLHGVLIEMAAQLGDEKFYRPLPKGFEYAIYVANVTTASMEKAVTAAFNKYLGGGVDKSGNQEVKELEEEVEGQGNQEREEEVEDEGDDEDD